MNNKKTINLTVLAMLFAAFGAFLYYPAKASNDAEDVLKPAIHIENAYIKKPSPGAQAAAGLMVIHNNTDVDNALIDVKSSKAGVVEIHEMAMENDIMRMRRVEKLIVPANASTALSMETGDHLMFLEMTHDYALDEVIDATLTFENGAMLEVEMPVIAMHKGMKSEHDHGHKMPLNDMDNMDEAQIQNGAEEDSAVDVEALHDHEHHGNH